MSPTDVHCLPRSSNQNGRHSSRHSSTQPFGPLPGLLCKAGNGGVGQLMPLLGTTHLKGTRTKTSAAEFQPASWTLSNPPLSPHLPITITEKPSRESESAETGLLGILCYSQSSTQKNICMTYSRWIPAQVLTSGRTGLVIQVRSLR